MNNRTQNTRTHSPSDLHARDLHDHHAQIQKLWATYAHLSPAQRAEVDAHLSVCDICAQNFQADQRLEDELHTLLVARQNQLSLQPQTQQARARFQQKLRQAQGARPFAQQRTPQRPPQRWLAIAATLLLLIFLATGVGQIWGGISLLIPVYATGTPQSKPTPTATVTATPQLGIASPTPQIGVLYTTTPFATVTIHDDPINLINSGIELALQREVEVWGAQEAASFDRYIDPNAAQEWRSSARTYAKSLASWLTRPTIQLLQAEPLTDDLALVQLQMTSSGRMNPIQFGRVYRYLPNEDRWYWSQPPAELWGEVLTLETAHLRFEYPARDADTIAIAAPLLENAYLKIHETLGVDVVVERDPQDFYYDKKLTLKILPEENIARRDPAFTYSFSSPGLSGAPLSGQGDNIAAPEAYAAFILTQISQVILDKAQEQKSFSSRGFAEVEMAIIRWLVNDSLDYVAYRGLEDRPSSQLMTNYPTLQLDDLLVLPTGINADLGNGELAVVSTALIDHIVAFYGREAIPTLARALVSDTDTWEKLIPATFGLSLTEFEQGWNSWWLDQHPTLQSFLARSTAIEESLALELAAREQMDASLVDSYVDPNASADWLVEHTRSLRANSDPSAALQWLDYNVVELGLVPGRDLARVRVYFNTNSDIRPILIEGRFYRRVLQEGGGERWLLTSPDESTWGEVLTLETDHFHIQYRQLDAAIVESAATQLEAGYSKLLRTLALPESRVSQQHGFYRDGKFYIDVVPESVTTWYPSDSTYRITSPFFFSWPNSADTSKGFAYAMLSHIVLMLSEEIYSPPTNHWSAYVSIGFNLWIVEDSLPAISYSISPNMDALIQSFHERILESPGPITMDRVLTLSQTSNGYLAGMLLLDYIAAIHGRDEIPRFLRGLNEYEGWEELIPVIFGVEVEQFEAGFDAWVRAGVGISQ